MTKKKCQPCITISTIWKLAKIHFRHFMQDVRAFNHVQEYSCKIHYIETPSLVGDKEVKKVREIASTNFKQEVVDDLFFIPEAEQDKINEQIFKGTN